MNSSQETLLDFDPERVISAIERYGAVSVPIVPECTRLRLLAEARTLPLIKEERYTGPNRVEQNLWSTREFAEGGVFQDYRHQFNEHLVNTFGWLQDYPFTGPIGFNEMVLQRYEPTDVGVSPHRDYSEDRNLICVTMIEGLGQFCLCDNRAGDNLRPLDSTPGNVIFLRAPGFRNSDFRPWHCAINVTTERYIVTLRQVVLS